MHICIYNSFKEVKGNLFKRRHNLAFLKTPGWEKLECMKMGVTVENPDQHSSAMCSSCTMSTAECRSHGSFYL